MVKELQTPPPTKIAGRRNLWETKYKDTIDPLSPRMPINYITSKCRNEGNVDESTTSLICESNADLNNQVENDEFVDAVENVTDIPFATI